MVSKFYQAKHILISEKEDAQYVLEKINQKESFEALAKEFSECESSHNGGDLGRFRSGVMDAEFEKALYQMKPGEVKGPIKTRFGYHIILKIS